MRGAWLLVTLAVVSAFVMPPAMRSPRLSVRRPAEKEEKKEELQRPEQPVYDVENPFADLQSPVTLTFLGFGLIAFNFFVVANL